MPTSTLIAHPGIQLDGEVVQRDGRWLTTGDVVLNPDLASFLDLVADGSVSALESGPFAGPVLQAMAVGSLT